LNVARCTWDDNVEGRSGVAPGPAAGTVAKGMRREGLKVARCTLHVGRQRGRAQRRCARTGGGDSGEGDEARGVEGCTLHVARGTTTWSTGSGDSGEGMRREGLKVARCTLHVGQQRGGAQRRCARTGSGDSGEGREARGVEGCTLHVARGTTTWRGAAALRPYRQRGQWRGDEARGERGARGLLTLAKCNTHD